MNQIFAKTKVFRFSFGEEIMMLDLFILIQCQSVTDRWTDRHLCSNNYQCLHSLLCYHAGKNHWRV